MANLTNKKRFALIPLTSEKEENALSGEILVNRTNGRIYVKRDDGEIVSETENLDEKIKTLLENYDSQSNSNLSFKRIPYRFFFDGKSILRLDRNLKLPSYAFYFTVKDVADEKLNYLDKPTKVTEDANYLGVLQNNKPYWVTFYNIEGDPLTQMLFTAKRADSIISDAISPDKLLSRIEIETSKDTVYVGDRFSELYCRIYAYYADGSKKDVTVSNGLIIDKPDLNTTGDKIIKALFYNIDDGRYKEATKHISVLEETFANIIGVRVIPRVMILNNGERAIKLIIYAKYDNGEEKNISERCVIDNFDPSAFNKKQIIVITTNFGHDQVYTTEYTIDVELNDIDYKVFFGDDLLRLTNELDNTMSDVKSFRVRDAGDLERYYTLTYVEHGTEGNYEGSIRTGQRLVVEFYDTQYKLLRSYICRAAYRPDDIEDDDIYINDNEVPVIDPIHTDPTFTNAGKEKDSSISFPKPDPMTRK